MRLLRVARKFLGREPGHAEPRTERVRPLFMRRRFGLLSLLLLVWACGAPAGVEEGSHNAMPQGLRPNPGGWAVIGKSPLDERHGSVGVWTGSEVLVVGGSTDHPCPPHADCALESPSTFRADGAAYDPAAGSWRSIAPAPRAIFGGLAAWTGHEMVVVSGSHTFAYAPDVDRWRQLDPRPEGHFNQVLAVDGDLLLGSYDQRPRGEARDWMLDVKEGSWRPLPRDPFGESYDRSFAWDGERLWLLSMAVENHFAAHEGAPSRVAVLDGGTWEVKDDATPDLVYEQRWWWFQEQLVVGPGPYPAGPALSFDGDTWSELREVVVPSGRCALPHVGPGPQWLAGGGAVLTSARPDTAISVPACDRLPEPDVAVWAGDELILWGGPDEDYDGNTAVGLRWRPPEP